MEAENQRTVELLGRPVTYTGECGLYSPDPPYIAFFYVVLDVDDLAKGLNIIPKEMVIKRVTRLLDDTTEQLTWRENPERCEVPGLIRPINGEHLAGIRNTQRLANDILKILQGE